MAKTASCSSYKYSSVAENIVQTLKVRLFTTKVIKSHVKLHMKSNATEIPRESTPYITLFTARSRIFLRASILCVTLSWPPCKLTVFTWLACWQSRGRGGEGRGREGSLKEKWGLNKRKNYLRWMGWGAKQSII